MKMRNFLGLGTLLVAMSLGMTGCGKDDVEPEVLPDPLKNATYYMVGIVTDAENIGVSGAEVSVDAVKATTDAKGKYSLAVDKTGKHTLSIKPTAVSGLEPFSAEVTIAATAANRSTLTLNVTMAKAVKYSESVVADDTKEVEVKAPAVEGSTAPAVKVALPAAAAPAGTKISIGQAEKASVKDPSSADGKKDAKNTFSSVSIKVDPTNAVALKPIIIAMEAQSTTGSVFFDASSMLAEREDVVTRAATELPVVLKDGQYEVTIKAGQKISGNYTTQIKSAFVVSKEVVGEENLANGQKSVKVDNGGNIAAIKDYEIKVAIKSGWEYTTPPVKALEAIGVNDLKLAATIDKQIQSGEGGQQVYTTERVLKTNISGNCIMYYQNNVKYCTKTYSFNLVVNGSKKTINVVLKSFTGSVEKYTNVNVNQHSGGGTN